MSTVSTHTEEFIAQLRQVVEKVSPGTSLEKLIEADKTVAAEQREGSPRGADGEDGDGGVGPEWAADVSAAFADAHTRLGRLDLR
jgi:hypothetical protein